jgi:hypothetical protein
MITFYSPKHLLMEWIMNETIIGISLALFLIIIIGLVYKVIKQKKFIKQKPNLSDGIIPTIL